MNTDQYESFEKKATKKKSECLHKEFTASVGVNRLVENEDDIHPTGFSADIRINCAECGEKFHFIGVNHGLSKYKPTVEVGGCELRCPIAAGELQFVPSHIRYDVTNVETSNDRSN